MPKAKLEFDLPEEREEFDCAVNGGKYMSCLWDIDQWLRSQIKYVEESGTLNIDTLEKVRGKLHELLMDHNIEF